MYNLTQMKNIELSTLKSRDFNAECKEILKLTTRVENDKVGTTETQGTSETPYDTELNH